MNDYLMDRHTDEADACFYGECECCREEEKEDKWMNIYEKMQEARCELQNMSIKKSGQNKFSGYSYYELGDILPHINNLLKKHKLFSNISFGDLAILEIVNSEKPDEKVTFTSTVAGANLKGCHPIQNLGAIQTYLRRYLYMNAFEIVEHDVLDATTDTKKETEKKPEVTDAQIKMLYTLADKKGVSKDDLKAKLKEAYGIDSTKELTKKQFDAVKKGLENKEDK